MVSTGLRYCWQISRMGVPSYTSGMKGSTMAPVTTKSRVTITPMVMPEPMASFLVWI